MRTSIVFASMVVLSLVLGVAASGFAADACVQKSTGLLRIVSSPADCRSGESPIVLASPATFTATVGEGSTSTLATLDNGVTITGKCTSLAIEVDLSVSTGPNLQASGTVQHDGIIGGLAGIENPSLQISSAGLAVDFGGIARDKTVGTFARIDVHGFHDVNECRFWGMIIPSS